MGGVKGTQSRGSSWGQGPVSSAAAPSLAPETRTWWEGGVWVALWARGGVNLIFCSVPDSEDV